MPQIIVIADQDDNAPVLLRERINPSDFESDLFGRHLVERLGWAVEDARAVEHARPGQDRYPREPAPQRSASVVTTAS
jgi:hypothetical protein